jgi:hypothetical protein
MNRVVITMLALVATAIATMACGTDDKVATTSPTIGQATIAITSTAAVTPPGSTNCGGSVPIQPPAASDVAVNADADGIPDRLAVFAQPAPPGATVEPAAVPSVVATTTPFAAPTATGTFQLQLVLDGGIALNIEASPTTLVQAAPIGGYDVDGDGRDELFAVTGNGAYTTWIDVFEFDPATCTLARITNPDPHAVPPLFAVGASVRNGVGLECVDHLLVATSFTSGPEEPIHYTGTRTSYRIVDTHIEQVAQTNVEFGVDAATRVAPTLHCGNLQLRP